MNSKRRLLHTVAIVCILVAVSLGLTGCAEETVRSPGAGPGVENSAASSGGDVIPATGGAGNGGGISGGGAGAGSAGQGR